MDGFILECSGITKSYKQKRVLNEVSFSCQSGHIYALAGMKGAGKTTLLRILSGLSFLDGGDYSLFGASASHSNLAAERRRIGSLIDRPILFESLSGLRNLEYLCRLRGIHNQQAAKYWIELFGLDEKKKTKVRYYTMSMKQRLGIACAMLETPQLLLLDEPFQGLDPKDIRELQSLLQTINQEQNMTMLITTPYPEQLFSFASDYIFLHEGNVLEILSQRELEHQCDGYISLETEELAATISALPEFLPQVSIETFPERNEIQIRGYMGRMERISTEQQFRNLPVKRIEQAGLSVKDYLSHLAGGNRHAENNSR